MWSMYPNLQREYLVNGFPPGHPAHRRPLPQENRCLDVIGFLIGLYHFVYSGCMAMKESRAWYDTGIAMLRNNVTYSPALGPDFMIPHAYKISTYIMYSSLGLILLYAIFQKSVTLILRWLIWVGVLDVIIFINTEVYRASMFTIMWEMLKTMFQLSLVWSLVEEMRKEEVTEERRDNVRQAIVEERQQQLQRPFQQQPQPQREPSVPFTPILPMSLRSSNPNPIQVVPVPVPRSSSNGTRQNRASRRLDEITQVARTRALRRLMGLTERRNLRQQMEMELGYQPRR